MSAFNLSFMTPPSCCVLSLSPVNAPPQTQTMLGNEKLRPYTNKNLEVSLKFTAPSALAREECEGFADEVNESAITFFAALQHDLFRLRVRFCSATVIVRRKIARNRRPVRQPPAGNDIL